MKTGALQDAAARERRTPSRRTKSCIRAITRSVERGADPPYPEARNYGLGEGGCRREAGFGASARRSGSRWRQHSHMWRTAYLRPSRRDSPPKKFRISQLPSATTPKLRKCLFPTTLTSGKRCVAYRDYNASGRCHNQASRRLLSGTLRPRGRRRSGRRAAGRTTSSARRCSRHSSATDSRRCA